MYRQWVLDMSMIRGCADATDQVIWDVWRI